MRCAGVIGARFGSLLPVGAGNQAGTGLAVYDDRLSSAGRTARVCRLVDSRGSGLELKRLGAAAGGFNDILETGRAGGGEQRIDLIRPARPGTSPEKNTAAGWSATETEGWTRVASSADAGAGTPSRKVGAVAPSPAR